MYIKLLLRLFLGYVRIEIEGYYVERFINICTNQKILIWSLKREKGVKLYLNLGINDFKKISSIAKRTNCKIKIIRKRGIPFILNKYKKRKIFAVCLIIILSTILISSRYIWNIEIIVEDNLPLDNIEQDIKKVGLNKGILKSKVNTDAIINDLRLKRDDIAWVGIDLKGTNVKVNIVKAKSSPSIINNTDYCNIVAKKPGIITKVIAQNGTAIVNINDVVQTGDVLIAGYMEGKYTDRRYVHSLGEVLAKVSYKKTKEIELNEDIYNETGKKENKYEVNLNKLKFKLYFKESKFQYYKRVTKDTNFKISKNFYLPISITQITNNEQIRTNRNYTLEEAIKLGVEKASKELDEELVGKDNIIDKKVDTEQKENSVVVTVTYEVIEEIGENEKIE